MMIVPATVSRIVSKRLSRALMPVYRSAQTASCVMSLDSTSTMIIERERSGIVAQGQAYFECREL